MLLWGLQRAWSVLARPVRLCPWLAWAGLRGIRKHDRRCQQYRQWVRGARLCHLYVFDPPPSLVLEHMARRQYLGSLYDNEPHFLRKLLAAKCVRTTDPARARLFYVPTFAYALWGNVANDLHEKRTMGRLAAWLHNQPAFRGLLHSTRRTVAWPLHCRA